MRAYKQTITKTEFVRELKAHQKADNFVKGRYFERGKGCAVGCSLESISRVKKIKFAFDDHSLYPEHLGIPEWLARVEDQLFEGMSEDRSKTWPVQFAQAIPVGADLEKAKVPFIVMLLEHSLASMDAVKFDEAGNPDVVKVIAGSKAAVKQMIRAQKSGDEAEIGAAWAAAGAAAWAAESAARSAAWAAWAAARSAAWAAESAESAESAAWSARSAAWSARSAAASAARSARSAESAAWSAAFDYYADRLLEILKECK